MGSSSPWRSVNGMSPALGSAHDRQHFAIVTGVIALSRLELARERSTGVFFPCLIHLREDSADGVGGSVDCHDERQIGVGQGQDRTGGENFPEGLERALFRFCPLENHAFAS